MYVEPESLEKRVQSPLDAHFVSDSSWVRIRHRLRELGLPSAVSPARFSPSTSASKPANRHRSSPWPALWWLSRHENLTCSESRLGSRKVWSPGFMRPASVVLLTKEGPVIAPRLTAPSSSSCSAPCGFANAPSPSNCSRYDLI